MDRLEPIFTQVNKMMTSTPSIHRSCYSAIMHIAGVDPVNVGHFVPSI